MEVYRLGSSSLVYAPGVIAYLRSMYASGKRKPAKRVLAAWGLPDKAACYLLKCPEDGYRVEDETVVFEFGGVK